MKYIIAYGSSILAFITTVIFGEMTLDSIHTLPINKDQNPYLFYLIITMLTLVFITMFIVYYKILNYYFILAN